MGVLSSITEVVTSGVTWAVNKLVSGGGLFVAGLVTLMTWITGTLAGALVGLIQPLVQSLPPMSQGMTDLGLWLFGLFVAPYATPVFTALAIRFVIRRLPVIG